MTKKDYLLIAQALHEVRPLRESKNYEIEIETWTSCMGSLIKHLKKAYPDFSMENFLIACERGPLR